ncbi:hypothetical protein tb265_33460 [Gemmatimonadetes bacterium T265]|nr:hypothetical protein tb265_33460 [Gemmatimonadetes bacterium T265]
MIAVAARGAAQPPTTVPLPAPPPGPTVRATPPAPPDTGVRRFDGRPLVACRGQPIHEIVVDANPPLGNQHVPRRLKKLERHITAVHATTREGVIRRFLLLHEGDPCDELRRSESERVLRAQPFLVDARVRPYADSAGGVILLVSTRDEFSLLVALAAFTGGGAPPVSTVRLGEANLMGQGIYASAEWYWGGVGYRDGYLSRVTDYQFLGKPYQFSVVGERRDVGGQWAADLSHPFYTDLQRVGWRTSAGDAHQYLELLRPGGSPNALFYDRRYANVGGIVRLGVPGRLSLFGASASFERASTADRVRVLSDTGVVPDGVGPPLGFPPSRRFPGQNVARLNALWGVRDVTFERVTGFDALTGTQDVRHGFQASVLLGRSVPVLNSHDDDYFVSGDGYAGAGTARSFFAAEMRGEARRDNALRAWDGVIVGGRGAWYLVPNARFRVVSSVEYGGTRRPRIPMQLSLGDRDGGVRGYDGSTVAGAARAVARVEPRVVFGPKFGLGEFGAAAFADVGRLWAGDAPYGVTTPPRAAVGVGLLGAFPPGSRRLWRVDLARPLTREPGAPKFRLIFDNRDMTRTFWREPGDVSNGRERSAPASLYNWP